MAVLESDDRERVRPLRALQIRHASPNEIGKATKIKLGKVDMASLAETKEGQHGVFIRAVRDVTISLNAETVDLRRDVGLGDHGLHVGHRHGCLCDVDDAQEERHGVESGRRPVARRP